MKLNYCTHSYNLLLKVNTTSNTETKSWAFLFTQDNKVNISTNLQQGNAKI